MRLSKLHIKLGKLALAVLILLLIVGQAFGAIYYVDTAADGDAGAGTSTAANVAWKTIAKVNASSFSAGDSILFKRGCTWREELKFPSSGSAGNLITFGSYGSGNKPKVYGSLVPDSWTQEDVAGGSTPTKIQSVTLGTGTTPITATYASTPTAGNLMVAFAKGSTTCANASITGWTLATNTCAQVGSGTWAGIFYKIAGESESKDVTLTWTSSTSSQIAIEEWTNIAAIPFDVGANNSTYASAQSKTSGTTATTAQNDELIIAGWCTGNTITTRSFSNSFTVEYESDVNVIFIASLVVSSTGEYESTLSWTSTARLGGGCIAAFKAATSEAKTLFYAAQAVSPEYLFFIANDGVIHTGSQKTNKVDLASEYDWWFDDPNNRLYVYAATTPATRYASVEVPDVANRTRGIWWGGVTDKEYVAVDGFEIAFTPGVGIVLRGNSQAVNNYIHHIGDEAGKTGHSYGIEMQTGGGSTASNNIVHNTYSAGIYAVASYDPYGNSNFVIESNTVYDCKRGLIRIACRDGYTMQNYSIRKNYLYHSSGFSAASDDYGINYVNEAGSTHSAQINNNIIIVNRRGIDLANQTTNVSIYNNTLKSTLGYAIAVAATGVSGITLKNNLVVDAGLYALQVTGDGTQITACDYNIWYAPSGTGYVLVGAAAYHSDDFAAYKSDTGWDAHGLWQNPLLTATYELGADSPAIDAGVATGLHTGSTIVGGDAAGNTRLWGNGVDIGAYERSKWVFGSSGKLGGGKGAPGFIFDSPDLYTVP